MTDLETKADESTPVVRPDSVQVQHYRLESTELVPADEIGNEQFPQYGDFAETVALASDSGKHLGPRYVEVPADLARALVDADVGAGDSFRVETATKTEDGAWSFEVEKLSNGKQESLDG